LRLARMAREEINKIEGLYAFGKELIGTPGCHDFDETKLGICVSGLGYTGYEMEAKLRKEYNIQIEMSDLSNILAIVSIGDREENLVALINALKDIAAKTEKKEYPKPPIIPPTPKMIVSPRDAFYSPKKIVPLDKSVGEISGEMVMAYPPGIPVVCMGERITQDIVDYIKILKEQKTQLQGTADPYIDHIMVLVSDRVYVLSGRPAHVIKTLDIEFPRPRDREVLSSPKFLEYKDALLKALL